MPHALRESVQPASWATGDFASVSIESIPGRAWAALSYLIVFGSLMAYPAYVWLLKCRPIAEVGTHAYVNPVVAVIIGGLCLIYLRHKDLAVWRRLAYPGRMVLTNYIGQSVIGALLFYGIGLGLGATKNSVTQKPVNIHAAPVNIHPAFKHSRYKRF